MSRSKVDLPPHPLPALPDPSFPDGEGIYEASGLRDVCGSRINPDSVGIYKRRSMATNPNAFPKTAAHPELEAWIGDVGGFDPRSMVSQPPIEEWPLSAVCARVAPGGNKMPFPLEPMTYMIDYGSIHTNPRALPDPERVRDYRENHFPEGSQLLLSFFGERALTVGLWALTEFWRQPWLDQFTGVILPDFSAFSDDPWPQSLIGERMHQVFAEEGSAANRTVIPSIAWASEASLARQVELWTSAYPYVNTIRLDCLGHHVNKAGWAWRWLFAIEKYCKGHDHIRWVISGMTAGWMIRELNEIFPARNYCLTTTLSTFIAAQRGTSDKEQQAQKFRRSIRALQDFRAGREVAERQPRPDHWPKFSDVRQVIAK